MAKNKIKKSIEFHKQFLDSSIFEKVAKNQIKKLNRIHKQKIKKNRRYQEND